MEANITGDLTEIPGIGPAAAKKLAEGADPITNSWMLFGVYLNMKGPDGVDADGNPVGVDCVQHNDRFWWFLKEKGISAHRSAICRAVAEKVSLS
jgi:hypothetical protein